MFDKLLEILTGQKIYLPTPDNVQGYPDHRQCLKTLLQDKKIKNYLIDLDLEECIKVCVDRGYNANIVRNHFGEIFANNKHLEPSAPLEDEINDLNKISDGEQDVRLICNKLNIQSISDNSDKWTNFILQNQNQNHNNTSHVQI